MADNVFLSQLIQSGPDAQGNLYKATFTFAEKDSEGILDSSIGETGKESLAVRLTKYNSPNIAIQAIAIPYQNINLNIPVAGTTLENKLSLSFRMDDNYRLYTLLKSSIPLNSEGTWSEEKESSFKPYRWKSIKVEAYRGNKISAESGYKDATGVAWEYIDCNLLGVPSLSYGYGSAQSLEVTCNFIYSYCKTT
jgi:hypothetical protein